MADAAPKKTSRDVKPINGVDTPTLFATLDAVAAQPDLAKFTWRASSRWVKGTHTKARFETFTGAGGDHVHQRTIDYDMDHPQVLVGKDNGPTPVEMLMIALAGCITSGIGNIAAARGVELSEVTSTVEGDMNLLGILGLSKDVRNGYEKMRVNFTVKGDADPETLRKIVEQSRDRSAVFDVITNSVPIELNIQAG
jgi:uncharacterized OsmC-like protein